MSLKNTTQKYATFIRWSMLHTRHRTSFALPAELCECCLFWFILYRLVSLSLLALERHLEDFLIGCVYHLLIGGVYLLVFTSLPASLEIATARCAFWCCLIVSIMSGLQDFTTLPIVIMFSPPIQQFARKLEPFWVFQCGVSTNVALVAAEIRPNYTCWCMLLIILLIGFLSM